MYLLRIARLSTALLSFSCSLTSLTLLGQQFAVHLANVPQVPLDMYVFCCGLREEIKQGQACINFPWPSCPSILNLVITTGCNPRLDQAHPWIERCIDTPAAWYQLELVQCAQGYWWNITSITPELQPTFIPDHTVILYMPAQYVDRVAMPSEGKDYLATSSVIKSAALVHLPTIYLKSLPAEALRTLQEDLDRAYLSGLEFDQAHAQTNTAHKQMGAVIVTSQYRP